MCPSLPRSRPMKVPFLGQRPMLRVAHHWLFSKPEGIYQYSFYFTPSGCPEIYGHFASAQRPPLAECHKVVVMNHELVPCAMLKKKCLFATVQLDGPGSEAVALAQNVCLY